jgi:hypothetical protein
MELSEPSLMILDEPTNHMDAFAREAIEEALVGVEGTLLVVSHDRYLLEKLNARLTGSHGQRGAGSRRTGQRLFVADPRLGRIVPEVRGSAWLGAPIYSRTTATPPAAPSSGARKLSGAVVNDQVLQTRP